LPLHTAEDAETWTAFFKASLQLKEKIEEKKNELSSFKNSFIFFKIPSISPKQGRSVAIY
jgi:hypothetical protein